MEVEHWLARALDYSIQSGRSRAVAWVTGSRRSLRIAEVQRSMANGFLEIGFNQLAAARREGGTRAAAVRPAEGGGQDEGQ